MAALTPEQIEQKKELLAEKTEQMRVLANELMEAGVIELSEEELNTVVGGSKIGDWFKGLGKKIKDKMDEDVFPILFAFKILVMPIEKIIKR